MTVQRFKTIEEMAAAPVLTTRGEGFERFARQCARYWRIAPRIYPRGVFRFRTVAEAQASREQVTDENVERLRAIGAGDGAQSNP